MSKIEIARTIKIDGTIRLKLCVIDQNGVEKFNVSGHYFADSENSFISYYLLKCDLEYMKSKVLEAIYQLPENNRDIEIRESLEIDLIPRPHGISCMENKDITNQSSEDNIISQSQLKEKLVSFDKDSEVMQYFEDNRCSVCLTTYKEIVDENVQIVFPICGHPLCCKCADNILKSTKKECPRCRGSITADSFNLMKFNADLKVENKDQSVFL